MRSLAVCWKVHKRCLHFFSACSPFSTSENWQSVEIEEIDGSEVKKGKKGEVFFVESRARVETQENNLWFANRVRPTLITLQTQCPLHRYYRPPPPSQNWPLMMMMMNHWQWIIVLHSLLMMIRASYIARESSQKMMSSYFGKDGNYYASSVKVTYSGHYWRGQWLEKWKPWWKVGFCNTTYFLPQAVAKSLLVFVLQQQSWVMFKKCAANLQYSMS